MHNQFLLIKNAVANLARGGAIAAFSLLLPPFLVRHLPIQSYAVWVLVLQSVAYVSYLDLGLQTALGRFVAYAEERADRVQRDSVYSTSLLGLTLAGLLSCVLLVLMTVGLPRLFPAVPANLMGTMRWMLLLVGFSVAIGLPASVCNGVLLGLQRNEIPAATTGGGKILAAAAIIIAILSGRGLLTMACILGITNILAYALQYGAMRKVAPDLSFRLGWITPLAARELSKYCLSMTVMSLSMLLISGLDVILVGKLQFNAIVPYAMSASLIPILGGLLYAILNALIPQATRLHARQSRDELGSLVIFATKISFLLLAFIVLPGIMYAVPILTAWLGPAYVPEAKWLLILLLIANGIRLLGAPYSIVLVATAQHKLIKASPVAEGISNLIASIGLGITMGALGVAFGTLIGAVVGVAVHVFFSMPRSQTDIRLSRKDLFWLGAGQPALCTIPLLACALASACGTHVSASVGLAAFAASLGVTWWFLFPSGILPPGIVMLRNRS